MYQQLVVWIITLCAITIPMANCQSITGELSVGPATQTTIAANWTFASSIEKLQVSLLQESPKVFIKDETLNVTQNSILYDGLTPLTEYSVSVEGSVDQDTVALKKKIYTKGPPVENVKVDASDVSGTKATISFDEVTSLTGTSLQDTAVIEYKICPKDKPDGPGCKTGSTLLKGSTSIPVDGLSPNTEYTTTTFVKNPANDRTGPVTTVEFKTQPGIVPVPENTKVDNVKNDSATFSYTLPNNNSVTNNVQARLTNSETGESSTSVRPAGQPIPLNNLLPGTQYTVQARSVAADGRNSNFSSPVTFTTAGPKPVGTVSTSGITDTSATISWPPNSSPVDEYKVTLTDSTGAQQVIKVPGNMNTTTIQSLTPDQPYAVTVQAVKDGITGVPSQSKIFKTLKTVPPPQATVSPDSDNANVSYTLNPDVEVKYLEATVTNTETGQTTTTEHPVSQQTSGQFNVPGLTSGTPYTLTLKSVAADGRTSVPTTTNFTTTGPKPVGKPTVSNVLDRSLTVSWPPSSDTVDGYEVVITDPNNNTRSVTVPGDQTQTTVGQLNPETEYTTTVYATKNGVRSTTSPTSDPATTLADVPEPKNLKVEPITTNSASLSYEIPSNNASVTTVNAVIINRDTGEQISVTLPAQQPTGQIPFQGLTPGTEYFIRMKTIAADNRKSDYVTTVPFMTAGPKRVGKPVVNPEQMSDQSGTISWPANTGDVDTYEVTVTDSAGNSRIITAPGNETFTTVVDFTPDTDYTVQVVAVQNGLKSVPSESTPFKTKPKAPQPENLTVTNIAPDSASVTFNAPTNNTELYRVQAVLTNQATGERKVVEVQADSGVISFTGLEPATNYSMVTRGVTEDGRFSDPTDAITFTTAGPKRVGKPVVNPEQMSDQSGTISWPANTGDVDTYEVTVTDSAGNSRIITAPGNETFTTVVDFTPDTDYTVQVVAVQNGLKSVPSESTSFKTKPKAPQPENLTVTNIAPNSASVTFNAPTNNTELYRVQAVLTNQATGERKVVEVQADSGVISFTGLEPGTNYSMVARGVTKDGRFSDPTDAITFTTATPTTTTTTATTTPPTTTPTTSTTTSTTTTTPTTTPTTTTSTTTTTPSTTTTTPTTVSTTAQGNPTTSKPVKIECLKNPVLDLFCKKGDGVIAHPQSPHYYMNCWAGLVEECKKCPGKMFFNADCGACADELCGKASCKQSTTTTTQALPTDPSTTTTRIYSPNSCPTNICREKGVYSGLIPHPNNVQRFISCDFYDNRGCQNCPGILWFNPVLKVCDWPEAVKKVLENYSSPKTTVSMTTAHDDPTTEATTQALPTDPPTKITTTTTTTPPTTTTTTPPTTTTIQTTSTTPPTTTDQALPTDYPTDYPTTTTTTTTTTEDSTLGTQSTTRIYSPNSCPTNICREKGVYSGLIPHPNNVQRFISCDFYDNRGCQNCPGILWFNPVLKVCDWPEAVKKVLENYSSPKTTVSMTTAHDDPTTEATTQALPTDPPTTTTTTTTPPTTTTTTPPTTTTTQTTSTIPPTTTDQALPTDYPADYPTTTTKAYQQNSDGDQSCPENICEEKKMFHGYLVHPSNQARFIQCAFGHVAGCHNCPRGTKRFVTKFLTCV